MSASSRRVIYAAMAGNLAIAVSKFIAAALSGSSAMLSEGVHSLVDTGNQVLLLHGLKRAQKPPDRDYPFGHGKEVYFWSFVVAILIFALGAGISFYEGIVHILRPRPLGDPWLNYLVLALALIFEGAAWLVAFKEFSLQKGRRGYLQAVRRSKDPATFVVLFEDSAAMTGLLAAFLGIWLGHIFDNHYFDGVASMVIGLILGLTAIWLAYETKGLLIGERAESRVIEGIRAIAAHHPAVEQVGEVLTLHMGPQYILVNLSLDFADDLATGQVEDASARLCAEIQERFPRVKRVFIEPQAYCGGLEGSPAP